MPTNISYTNFLASNWSTILQNTSCESKNTGNESKETVPTGKLIIKDKSVKVEIILPGSEKKKMNLDEIIDFTKTILESDQFSTKSKVEILKNLKNFNIQLKEMIEQDPLARTKNCYSSTLFFSDDVEELCHSILNTSQKVETNEEKAARLLYQEESLGESEVNELKFLCKDNIGLLKEVSKYQDLNKNFIFLAEFLLLDLPHLSEKDKKDLIDFIFTQTYQNRSLFQHLMQQKNSNLLFDEILKTMTDDDYDQLTSKRKQILEYAYSDKRYQYVFLNESDVPEDLMKKMEQIKEKAARQVKPRNTESVKAWSYMLYQSSTTLFSNGKIDSVSTMRFERAQEYLEKKVFEGDSISFEDFCQAHKELTQGEVDHPGELRQTICATSGGKTHNYCPPVLLEQKAKEFFEWFNQGISRCDQGELNPILFASQALQRSVSYHFFENGNGRMSRLLMKYVLDRYNIVEPIRGQDCLDGVFPLDPRINQIDFINKIVKGLNKSLELLNKDK